jgi:hypothetical protein
VSGGLFFAITCAFVLGSGIAAALVQAGIFGLAGRFPPIYTQAVMSGQGVAGIIVSVTSLFSALSSSCGAGQSGSGSGGGGGIPSKEAVFPEAFYFFLTSTIVVVITLASFLSMNGSDFAQHYAFSMGEAASELEHDNDMDDPVTLIDAALDQGDADPATTPLSNGSSTAGSGRLILRSRSHRQSILNSPVFQKSPRTTGSSGSARSVGSAGSHSAQTSLSSIGERLGSVEEGIVVGDVAEEFANVVASPSTSVAVRRAGAELSGALLVADAPHESKPIPTCELISMIGRHCFSVCFVFVVTLSVFPAITSEIRSKSNLSNERCPKAGRFPFGAGVWQALFFLIFNVGDTVGRLLAGLGRPFAAKHVVWISLARVGFIPLFLLCTLASKTSGGKGPSPETLYDGGDTGGVMPSLGFFHEDYWPVLFMAIMAISNGWVASLEMMAGPCLVPDGQQSRAGTIMAFFLVLGLVLGSVLSFGVRALACNCNPFLPEQ